MGTWQLPTDLLAGARFVVSPMAEVGAALGALSAPTDPSERALAATVGPSFRAMLRAHPARAAVHSASARPGWIADFLGMPPRGGPMSFAEELELVAGLGDDRIRADLREVVGPRSLPSELEWAGVTTHLVELLEWVWARAVANDWPRRERVLQSDIVARTSRLAAQGWAGVLADLGHGLDWLGEGHLRINGYDNPTRDLAQARELYFIPHHGRGTWVGWDLPTRYAVHYPVTGALAEIDGGLDDALGRLLGPNRARILTALAAPASTSGLVAATGMGLGSVGGHLRVLLAGGLVLRRRSGREVLYWRTATGEALVASASTPAP